jgi:folate-binding protein YgfZ
MSNSAAPLGDPWALSSDPFQFVFPVSRLALTGPDSLRVLHGQTTQALEGTPLGERRLSCGVTATARLRALVEVEATAEGALLLVTAGAGAEVRRALDRVLFPADRVRLGPLEELSWHGLVDPMGPGGGAGWGLPGRHWLLAPGEALPPELAAVPPLGAEGQEWLRLRQGIPAAPGEINGDCNPFELGLDHRVSLNKGCYLGQETLAKLQSRDGVKQFLRRWWAPAGVAVPQVGQALVAGDGARAAVVSSVLVGSGLAGSAQRPSCGLALVRRAWAELPELEGLQLSLPAATNH